MGSCEARSERGGLVLGVLGESGLGQLEARQLDHAQLDPGLNPWKTVYFEPFWIVVRLGSCAAEREYMVLTIWKVR